MLQFNNRKPNALIEPEKGGPVHVLTSLIKLIDEMVELMTTEVTLVEQRKTEDHAELLKKKQRLTVDYRAALKSIALQPDLLKKVPDDLRTAAKAAASRLSEASEKNSRLLRTAILASQQLIQTIVGMVKEEVMPKNGYSNPFAKGQMKGAYSPTCQPVTGSRTA